MQCYPSTLCEKKERGQRAARGYCSASILTLRAQPKSNYSRGHLDSKGTACISASPKTQEVSKCQEVTTPVPS